MTSMHFEQIVDGTPAEIFAIVADFAHDDRWFPRRKRDAATRKSARAKA